MKGHRNLKSCQAAAKPVIESLESRTFLSASPVIPTPVYPALYGCDSSGEIFTVNAGTGKVAKIGNTGTVLFDIAENKQGQLYGVDSLDRLCSINATNAKITWIGNINATVNGLAFGPDGNLYGGGTNGLYTLNTTTGRATQVLTVGTNYSAGDIAFDNTGACYFTTTANNLVKINVAAKTYAVVGNMGFGAAYGLAYGSNNVLYGDDGATNQLFSINTKTGKGTFVASFAGQGVYGCYGLASAPVPIVTVTKPVTPKPAITTPTVGAVLAASSIVVSADDTPSTPTPPPPPTVYATDAAGNLYTLNVGTGKVQVIGNSGEVLFDIAENSQGQLYGVDRYDRLCSINPANGQITLIGNLNATANALAFAPNGVLYAAGTNGVYTVNLINGHATPVMYLGANQSSGDITFDAAGNLYFTSTANNLIEANLTTLTYTTVGNLGFGTAYGLAWGSDGNLYGVDSASDQVFVVNAQTGQSTVVSSFAGQGVYGCYGLAAAPV